jgi:hypothetical protein
MRETLVWVLCVGGLNRDLLERSQSPINPREKPTYRTRHFLERDKRGMCGPEFPQLPTFLHLLVCVVELSIPILDCVYYTLE